MSITKDVSVRLSTSGADGVKAELTSISEQADKLGTRTAVISVDANKDDWEVEADEVLAKAKELGATKVRISIAADDEGASLALDHIRAKADELGLKKVNIKVDVSKSDVAKAEETLTGLQRFAGKLFGLNGSSGGGAGILGGLLGMGGGAGEAGGAAAGDAASAGSEGGGLLASLGPAGITAAIPAVAVGIGALTTEAGGLVTALGAVAAGIGSIGVLGIPVFKDISDVMSGTAVKLGVLSGPVHQIVADIKSIEGEFDAASAKFAPTMIGLIKDAMPIVKEILPAISKLANAAAPALGGLITGLAKGLASPAFKQFVDFMAQLEGPVLTALGKGLEHVAHDVGNLMERFSAKDVVNSINIAFSVLEFTIVALSDVIKISMDWWDRMSSVVRGVIHVVEDVIHWIEGFVGALTSAGGEVNRFGIAVTNGVSRVIHWFSQLPSMIRHAIGDLGNLLFSAGAALIEGLWHGIDSVVGGLVSHVESIGSKISGAFKSVLGIFSPSKVFQEHGRNIVEGLALGITSSQNLAFNAVRGLGAGVSNGMVTSRVTRAGVSAAPLQIEWVGGGGADAEFISWLKKNIRIRGGNPAVLGR